MVNDSIDGADGLAGLRRDYPNDPRSGAPVAVICNLNP